MNKSAKILFYSLVLGTITIIFNTASYALQFKPDKIENNTLLQIEIEIFSTYEHKADGMRIVFEVQGGSVVEYRAESDNLLSLGICTDDETFTIEEVCVDVASFDGIMLGDKLGTLIIETIPGEVALIIPKDIKYINQDLGQNILVEGILGVYSDEASAINSESTLSIVQEVTEDGLVNDEVDGLNSNTDDAQSITEPKQLEVSGNIFVIVSVTILIVTIFGVVYILKKKKLKVV